MVGAKSVPIRHPPGRVQYILCDQTAQQTVIRAKKSAGLGLREDNIALAADAGIHHHDMQGSLGEKSVCGGNHGRRLVDVMRHDMVAEIDEHGMGRMAQNDPLHHPDIFVPIAKVG